MVYKPHQQRVVKERSELKEKTDKLEQFLDTGLFNGLDDGEKVRLKYQYHIMMIYLEVLDDRIANFK